jgi:K+-transporting ATPase KdpF subunit
MMNVEYLVVGLIAFGLLVYLVYVLLSPERL